MFVVPVPTPVTTAVTGREEALTDAIPGSWVAHKTAGLVGWPPCTSTITAVSSTVFAPVSASVVEMATRVAGGARSRVARGEQQQGGECCYRTIRANRTHSRAPPGTGVVSWAAPRDATEPRDRCHRQFLRPAARGADSGSVSGRAN